MNSFKILSLSVSSFLIFGCASNSELRAVKLEAMEAVDQANQTAEQALTEAREAKQLAQDANSRALRSEEMLNRGFKRSMYK
jgi:outer membrane biogenesis lipoprotein LolB